MRSFASIACLLVAFATATPIHHEPRMMTASSNSQEQGSHSQSYSEVSPFGTSFGQSSDSYEHSESMYSSSQLFGGAMSLMNQMQQFISSQTMTESMAFNFMEQFSQQFSGAMGGLLQCGCGGQLDISNSFASFMSESTEMIEYMQNHFQSSFMEMMSGMTSFRAMINQFTQSFSSNSWFNQYSTAMTPFINCLSQGGVPGFSRGMLGM